MSLLNDMLRDLSHQQKAPDPLVVTQQVSLDLNAEEQRELFYNSSAAKPLPRTLVPSLVVFVLVTGMLVAWKLDAFSQQEIDELSVEAPIVDHAAVKPLVEKQAENTSSISQQDSLAVTAESTVDPLKIESALGERIAALESAITNLSTVVANANNQSSTESVDVALAAFNELRNIDPVVQNAEPLLRTENGLESAPIENTASVSIQEPFIQPENKSVVEANAEQGEPRLSIAPNAKWQDQQQAQLASELVAQGQTDVAIEKLQRFITAATEPRESAKTLLDIFAAQENTMAMQSIITNAGYLSIVEQTFYNAKIAVIQQQDTQAVQLLESHLTEAESDENYRSLLAGLYQRTGMHSEAANHYRRLLSVFGDKPAYWLGFALSQDALNQGQVAAQAYQRVNQYADLQPQVRSYVQQRIAALQQ